MSVNPPEGTLTIENSHLDVKGNVSAVALKLGTLRLTPSYGLDAVANVSNSTTHTLELSNATTGLVTTANVVVGKDLQVAGNATVSSNLTVGEELTVSGNATVSSNLVVDTNTLFVDSVGNKVGIGTTDPGSALDVVGDVAISSNLAVDTNTLFVDSVGNNVGIGTTNPGLPLEIYTGNGNNYGLRLRRYPTGPTYTDLGHLSTPGTEGLAIKTSDGNATTQEVMRICGNGNVGIGTSTPYPKLHVNGTGTVNMAASSRQYFRYDYNGTVGHSTAAQGYGWGDASIYANGAILSGDHLVSTNGVLNSSDERIKKNIVNADDAECLKVLRQLKPKKYQYKDEVKKGQEPVWGFIAQEVRENLPHATQLRTECLPNIYELANVSDSNVITFTNFDTSNLESNAMVLKVFDKDDAEHFVNITEVVDEHNVRVDEDLSDDKIFVYGQQVDDFHFLKKDAIWTVATSALQEVDRQQQADKIRISELETQLASVLTRLDALESA